jgi:hypothetical protein
MDFCSIRELSWPHRTNLGVLVVRGLYTIILNERCINCVFRLIYEVGKIR